MERYELLRKSSGPRANTSMDIANSNNRLSDSFTG